MKQPRNQHPSARIPRPLPVAKTSLLALNSLILCLVLSATAQNYTVDWHRISAGGGASTGGVFSVTGTIGQHDAGQAMSGGSYSVTGGFWSLLATVQTPGAPSLNIFISATNTAVVSWPSPSAGFNLQQNTDLQNTNWTSIAEAVMDNGTRKFIIVAPPSGARYFRLSK